MTEAGRPSILAIDTGGTMTDTFVVDDAANYSVGKAQSTPADEAEGVVESFGNALDRWGADPDEDAGALVEVVYSCTALLDRLLEREGRGAIGVIATGGFEDALRFGRGIQSWVDRSYAGRLHAREHVHPDPIVPRENVRGVRGRVNAMGVELLPLYEEEARQAVEDLLDRGVRVICVCLLFSYANPGHEERIQEIAEEVMEERGVDVPVWLSSEQNPVRGELPRMNTLILEAYAVEPSREQLYGVRDAFRDLEADAPVRILTSSGGTVSPDHDWLVETMLSGPIGGIFGGRHLASELDLRNVVCSDVGGTSFDVGLITEGHYPTRWDQSLAQFMVNIPMTAMDSIGSGTGSYVRVDRASDRLEIGPDSAGYRVGVSNADDDVDTPTVTDCTVVLGYLNPDYFLGGDIPLDVKGARAALEDDVAGPLGEDVHETARGVLDVLERDMATEIRAMTLGLGYSPENYHLLSYGGGGPLHVAGYTRSLRFKDVLVPDWAAAFSAFGCACADRAYRFDESLDAILHPDMSNASQVAQEVTASIEGLREKVLDAFARDGVDPDDVAFTPGVRVQYTGMLDDLEVRIPEDAWEGGLEADDLEPVVERYETEFDQIFRRGAHAPENGYQFTVAVGRGAAPTPKPDLPDEDPVAGLPPESASKGERPIFWDGDWTDADLWEMDQVEAGNVVPGPAVLEAPATTFLVPPGFEASLDGKRIYHLERRSE